MRPSPGQGLGKHFATSPGTLHPQACVVRLATGENLLFTVFQDGSAEKVQLFRLKT